MHLMNFLENLNAYIRSWVLVLTIFGLICSTISASAAPVSRGTADGSGGNTVRSQNQRIQKVLFDPERPHMSLNRRLEIAFHRLSAVGGFEDLFRRMFAANGRPDLATAIRNLKFVLRERPCSTAQGQHSDMAVANGVVCVSASRLRQIPPESLEIQMLALAAHELAHERGISSEVEANRVRDFFLLSQDFFMAPVPNLAALQIELARTLWGFDPIVEEEYENLKTRCHNLYFAMKGLDRVELEFEKFRYRPFMSRASWFADAAREMESAHCRKTEILFRESIVNPRTQQSSKSVNGYLQNVADVLQKMQAWRKAVEEFSSPFLHWADAFPQIAGKQLLLHHALGDGDSAKDRGAVRPSSLACSMDGERLSFDHQFCPTPTSESWNTVSGVGPVIENSYVFDELLCARKELVGENGSKQTLHFLAGPHSLYEMNSPMVFRNVIGLQIMSNFDRFQSKGSPYENLKQNFSNFISVSGESLMSKQNNVALLDYTNRNFSENLPRFHSVYSVLHPQNTPEMKIHLQMPAGYDAKLEKVVFEKNKHRVHCWIE